MAEEKIVCGTEQCLIDKLEESIARNQNASTNTIKEVLNIHITSIKENLKELRDTHEKELSEIWPRLRKLESGIEILTAKIVCRDDLTDKVKELIDENEMIKWVKTQRNYFRVVMAGVSITAIISFLGWLLVLYRMH